MTKEYTKLEDYGIIGDLKTCALIGRDGSIDWCCFPHMESASVFAAILDVEKGGHFHLQPRQHPGGQQDYLGITNVLHTTFETPSGRVVLTDFMPLTDEGALPQSIIRKVTCHRGQVEMDVHFKPRFDYARATPELDRAARGVTARWQDRSLFLQSPVALQLRDGEARGTFTLAERETQWFVLHYDHTAPLEPHECADLLRATARYWSRWAHHCGPGRCVFSGPWHDHVVRSGLVLKLLTHPETGAIAAAPTTSLPEVIGGVRNWDYRFAWIRDASLTVRSLYSLGHVQEALEYFRWLRSLCQQFSRQDDYFDIQIMYPLHEDLDLEEKVLPHLSGYKNSAPVRIGNAAAEQRQLDVYGELINAFYETRRYEEDVSSDDWRFIRKIANSAARVWDMEDSGIWEVRGGPRHFTYSKLMCWVALDRSVKMAQKREFEAPIDQWKSTRDQIRGAILEQGFSQELNSFVQAFGSQALDATSLLIPLMGFLPPEDPRVQGTIEATLEHLTTNGLVYRYIGDDGLPGQEGAFVLCTFWLVDALILSGRVDEARDIFLNVLDYISPLGLFAEQIDPASGLQLGNYPQAFSHIGLIDSALRLGLALMEDEQ